MTEIDAKVNMSLDDIIKMEKKRKITNGTGRGGGRGMGMRGRGRGSIKNGQASFPTRGSWKRFPNFKTRGGFVQKRFNTGLIRSRSNTALNFTGTARGTTRGGLRGNRGGTRGNSRGVTRGISRGSTRGVSRGGRGFVARRGVSKFGLVRSKSRSNLNFTQTGFFANKARLNRSNSLPNLQDPTNVHSRLGYQSPAQVAYRNRVKRAKQLLLQRQRMGRQRSYQVMSALKTLPSIQQRALERKQQLLAASPFGPSAIRSEQILRAQRRAQYEQKLLRLNAARSTPSADVNFMCTLGAPQFAPAARSRAAALSAASNTFLANSNPRNLQRGRSPFRQNRQPVTTLTPQAGRTQLFPQRQRRSRSRSRSRSRNRNNLARNAMNEMDDRSFSEVMYSLSGNLGVTGRTLNDRFSF